MAGSTKHDGAPSTLFLVLPIMHLPTCSFRASGTTLISAHPSEYRLWLISTLATLGWTGIREEELEFDAKSLELFHAEGGGWICIDLGLCKRESWSPRHWSRMRLFATASQHTSSPLHDCETDHIDSDSWQGHTEEFGDTDQTVRLSLTRCRINLGSTCVIHLELMGCVFESYLRDARITIPTRVQLSSVSPSSDSELPSRISDPFRTANAVVLSQPSSIESFSTSYILRILLASGLRYVLRILEPQIHEHKSRASIADSLSTLTSDVSSSDPLLDTSDSIPAIPGAFFD